jgi:hypothetical protein
LESAANWMAENESRRIGGRIGKPFATTED